MINVEKILKENNRVSAYQVNELKTESFEVFFVKDKLETIRKTDTLDQKVTVYVKHNNLLGQSTFSVLKSDNLKSLNAKINTACSNAEKINNKIYELPKDEHLSKTVKSNIKNYDFKELALLIYEAIKEEIDKSESKINALEIFIYKEIESIKNSNGINKKETKYSLFIEAIPTFDKKDDSFELYKALRFSSFDAAEIKNEVKESLENVRRRALAIAPKEKLNCDIVLNKAEVAGLFNRLKSQLNYSGVYRKSNLYNIGDNLQPKRQGDALNLRLVKHINGSTESRSFDTDGSSYTELEVIKNGKVTNFYGDNKYAQYLNMPVTGNLPCMLVKKGSLTAEELNSKPYLNCISFSGIQIDPFSDYIGGEVRLAYYYDGKKEIPLTGISISGRLSEVLKNIRFSSELALEEGYYGPKLALIKDMEIH